MLAGLRPIAGFRAAVAADEGEYEDEAKNRTKPRPQLACLRNLPQPGEEGMGDWGFLLSFC